MLAVVKGSFQPPHTPPTQHTALAVICSARRHGQRAAAAAMPHIQLVDVMLSETADAATYQPSDRRRSASIAHSASGTSSVTDPMVYVSGTIRKNIAAEVEQTRIVNRTASSRRPVRRRAMT